MSNHARKIPPKRETLKLATVGAVGIETPAMGAPTDSNYQ